jgi:hypothetical protein
MELVRHSDFIKINDDSNGTARFVCHWLAFTRFPDLHVGTYERALYYAKTFCKGKKYHNKKYGGGIAFATNDISEVIKKINQLQNLY